MSAPTDLLLPERITAVQRWAATCARGVQAAVTLLVEHDTWLRRSDFMDAATFVDIDENMLAIRWADAATFAATARGSSFEIAMLELSIALATDRYRLNQAGGANSATIRRAVDVATGGPGADVVDPAPDNARRRLVLTDGEGDEWVRTGGITRDDAEQTWVCRDMVRTRAWLDERYPPCTVEWVVVAGGGR